MPVYVAEAAFMAGQDQRKITNRQWDFKAMCALKTNPCGQTQGNCEFSDEIR